MGPEQSHIHEVPHMHVSCWTAKVQRNIHIMSTEGTETQTWHKKMQEVVKSLKVVTTLRETAIVWSVATGMTKVLIFSL